MGIIVVSWVDAGVEHFREVGRSLTFCGLAVPGEIRQANWAEFVPGAVCCEACNAGLNIESGRLRRQSPETREPATRRR